MYCSRCRWEPVCSGLPERGPVRGLCCCIIENRDICQPRYMARIPLLLHLFHTFQYYLVLLDSYPGVGPYTYLFCFHRPENNNDYNTIWQECWDSTANMIDKCVSDQAKQSWWNGDHVYQFYAAGLRSLNDPYSHHAQNGLSLGTYLMPSTEGLSCINDCHGFVPNPDWCNKNCGGVNLRRRNRSLSLVLLSRSTENVAQVGNCALPYQLPDYPSAGEAATLPGVQKYYDRDDSISGNNNCNNPRLAGPVPAVRNSLYNSKL